MPYRFSFAEIFLERIQKSGDRKNALLAELKTVLTLKNPREKGGAYFRHGAPQTLWAYPSRQRVTFICRIDDENRHVVFIDLVSL